jgi:hypothetical protein
MEEDEEEKGAGARLGQGSCMGTCGVNRDMLADESEDGKCETGLSFAQVYS